jgi:large subunit ribosomal protein LP2
MKEMAVYLMLVLGGNASPSADDIAKALTSVGLESDATATSKLLAELEGKDLAELMELGTSRLAKLGGGGAGGAAEEAEEEKVEEEEEADLGGGDLFGGADAGGGGDY